MKFKYQILGFILAVSVAGCSGTTRGTSDSTSTDSTDVSANASTAVASVFGGSNASALRVVGVQAIEEDDRGDEDRSTCAEVLGGEAQSDSNQISTSAYNDPGAYGSSNSIMNVEEEDFCALPDGTENAGSGPDDDGLFAAFEIILEVSGDCENEDGTTTTIAMQTGSNGIWRNTSEYYPEVYGTFTFLIDGEEEQTLDCTIYLDENETALFADCSDDAGDSIIQDTSSSCQFSTD